MMKYPVILFLLFFSFSCSSQKGTYEAIQIGQRNDCQKLYGDEYDKCTEQYSKPYDEYKRDRDELIK